MVLSTPLPSAAAPADFVEFTARASIELPKVGGWAAGGGSATVGGLGDPNPIT